MWLPDTRVPLSHISHSLLQIQSGWSYKLLRMACSISRKKCLGLAPSWAALPLRRSLRPPRIRSVLHHLIVWITVPPYRVSRARQHELSSRLVGQSVTVRSDDPVWWAHTEIHLRFQQAYQDCCWSYVTEVILAMLVPPTQLTLGDRFYSNKINKKHWYKYMNRQSVCYQYKAHKVLLSFYVIKRKPCHWTWYEFCGKGRQLCE